MRVLSPAQIAAHVRAAGYPEELVPTKVAIAMAESSGNPRAHNPNASTGDNSYGLFQVNMLGSMGAERRRQLGLTSNDELFDPAVNARAAKQVFDSQGLGAWSVYKSGAYKKFMPEAQQAAGAPPEAISSGQGVSGFSGQPLDWLDPQRMAGLLLEELEGPRSAANPLADVALAAVGSGSRPRFAGRAGYRQALAEAVQPMEDIQRRLQGDDYIAAAIGALEPVAAGAAPQPSMATAGSGAAAGMQTQSGDGSLRVGRIADPSEDIFPTTGAHLDVRVMTPEGQYINPETARSLLQHLRVGGKPLYQQQGGDWLATQPVTSGFGPRRAPVAGASTLHNGIDYGVAAQTPLEWTGGGQYSFDGGIGRIILGDGTTVKLLHTRPF